MNREAALVELVSDDGAPVGVTTVALAHEWPGLLHRAFSVLLLDRAGRMLLQRRAAEKTRFALRWANACCGHPAPGERVSEAAARRLGEELGARVGDLTSAGVYVYRARDPASGRVEHEYDHVLVGRLETDHPLIPDATEVADLRWVVPARLRADVRARPTRYAPWLAGVLATWQSSFAAGSAGG